MNDSKISVGIKKVPIHLQSSQNRILIKGGKVVNDDCMQDADVYIEDGIIKQVGNNLMVPGGVRTIEAKGKMVIPGGIDTHTHLQMPFMGTFSVDDFYSGTRAALAGGTTMIIDFVACPRGENMLEWYDKYRNWADAKVCCDYALHMIVPHFTEKTAAEIEILVKEKGINSFKAFLAYSGVFLLEDDELYNLMKTVKSLGGLTMVHAENGKVIEKRADEIVSKGITGPEGHYMSRAEELEAEATSRAVTIARETGCPLYVVHVMSRLAADIIGEARRRGDVVFGEPIAAGLACDNRSYFHSCWRHAAGHVMSPPLRDPATPEYLMQLLGSGDLQCTGTDHCVFKAEQKALGKDDFRRIPNGVNGVEDRMSVIWEKGVVSGILDPCKFVAVTSANAARIFNIYPRKGRIDVGSDADIVLWDPKATRTISAKTHHQLVDFNIFEGMKCHGVADLVISGGRVVIEEGGEVRVTQGAGRFVPTPPHAQYVYGRVPAKDRARDDMERPVARAPFTGAVIDLAAGVAAASLAPSADEAAAASSPPANTVSPPAPPRSASPPLPAAAAAAAAMGSPSPGTPGSADDSPVSRPPTRSGGRNLQESSFSLSGKQMDDDRPIRTAVRTANPPGGKSSGIF